MKRFLLALALPLLLGAAPASIIAGVVRDQHGSPIAGALVRAGDLRTRTDRNGTFALTGTSSATVAIACAYCRNAVFPVASDGTVVAIVVRYEALARRSPSRRDLAALPYARIASALALQPFTLLNQSTGLLPGAQLSRYGASAFGGLIVDDGIPIYDLSAGMSGLRSIAPFTVVRAHAYDAGDTPAYGDSAAGGSFFLSTIPMQRSRALAAAGSQRALNLSQTSSNGGYDLAFANDNLDTRARAGLDLVMPLGSDSLEVNALLARDWSFSSTGSSIATNESAIHLHYDRIRTNALYADLFAVRSGYAWPPAAPAGGWSEIGAQAGISSRGSVQVFADAGVRASTGFYDASALHLGQLAANALETHVDAGVRIRGNRYVLVASAAASSLGYAPQGEATQAFGAYILDPSLRASYDFTRNWSTSVAASSSFRLPTLLESYDYSETFLPFDRYGAITQRLTYSDRHRVRLDIVAMNEGVGSLDTGTVHSAGISLSWQVSPLIALRAWSMHVDDTSRPTVPVLRFGSPALPATVGSLWATYENPAGLRIDAIYRTDLINYLPDRHFDASISAPVARGLRWFAGTERRNGIRYVDAGLRIAVAAKR